MTSWLQRASVRHACSYRVLLAPFGLTSGQDPDFDWPWSVVSTARFLSTSPRHVMEMIQWRHGQIRIYGRASVMGSRDAPAFRVCPVCVGKYGFAHYRLEGRLDFVTLCPIHGVLMRGPFNGLNALASLQSTCWSTDLPRAGQSQISRERTLCRLAISASTYRDIRLN